MEKLFSKSLNYISRNPGIYYIKINKEDYIGSSFSIKKRLSDHKNRLIRNEHHNKWMQNIYNKYGQDDFLFSILETFEKYDSVQLLEAEFKWINKINPSLNHKFNPITQLNCKSTSKIVYQFDHNGVFVNEYLSVSEANRQTDISNSSISQVCNGKLNHAGGYLWSYHKKMRLDPFSVSKMLVERTRWKWRSVETIDIISGETTKYKNIAEAARAIISETDNFTSVCSTISNLCKKKSGIFRKKYKFNYTNPEAVLKPCELLENQEIDNQQPSAIEI